MEYYARSHTTPEDEIENALPYFSHLEDALQARDTLYADLLTAHEAARDVQDDSGHLETWESLRRHLEAEVKRLQDEGDGHV